MSPVIGMVLILAISVLGIVAVTNWGLPAILAMQQNVEMRSVLNEFGSLDGSMQKLIAGTTGQTTFKWQPGIGKGAVSIGPGSHRWMVTVDVQAGLEVEWDQFDDTNNQLRVAVAGGTFNSPKIHVYQWIEGVATELKATTDGSCGANWVPGSTGGQVLHLMTNKTVGCTAVNLDNVVLSFSIRNEPSGGAVAFLHDAYLADVGSVHWKSLAGTPTHVYHSNGAIFNGVPGAFVQQSPLAVSPVRAFKNSAGTDSVGLFARLVKLNGTASFSAVEGGARTSVFMDFSGTWTMGSHDDVERVSIYVLGDLQDATYAELKDAAAGYGFAEDTTPIKHYQYTETVKPFRFSTAYTHVEVQR